MVEDSRDTRQKHFADHRRQWRDFLYVYPVLARRSKGLSIGINLNHDKRCTFSCAYCQIDRTVPRPAHELDLAMLRDELDAMLDEAVSGRIWAEPRFATTPPQLRRINDIAFSGDGEPTCLSGFDAAVAVAAAAKSAAGLSDVKIVIITNSSHLRSPQVRAALPILDANNGEIWAKLDAGTEEYFRGVNRPVEGITLNGIVDGIAEVARGREIVIQSLFSRLRDLPPPEQEITAYCDRLRAIIRSGGRIRLVQVHTVARPPAEAYTSALGDGQLEGIAQRICRALPELKVETYRGSAFTLP